MKKLIVKIDENDGDILTNYVEISDEKFEKYLPLINAINDFRPYLTQLGVCTHNWPVGMVFRDDCGEKSPRELYSEYSNLIYDFSCDFLHFNCRYGFHTIECIKDVMSGKVYVNGTSKVMKEKCKNSQMIQEYHKEDLKFYKTKTKTGKYIHCEQYVNLTPEELELCKNHRNLWLEITKKYKDK